MKVLISGDEYCYSQKGLFFLSDTGMTLLKRYLNSFEQVVLAVRTKFLSDREERGKYKHLIGTKNVDVIPLPFFQGPKQFILTYGKIRKAICEILEKKIDLAILRLPSTSAFFVWRIAVKKIGIPYATEIVFDCFDEYQNSCSLFYKYLWKTMHKWQVNACHHAIGVSCVTQHYLQKRYYPLSKNAITSYYSSIELPSSFYYKPRHLSDKPCFQIVHVANQVQYSSRKGHNELIKVIAELKRIGCNVKLLFIGEDYDNGIAKLNAFATNLNVANMIDFSGYLSQQEMRDTMINMDIAVLPTRSEGLPRVIIEAMAMGLPCITSPVSGNPELISSDLLVDYSDIKGMANKIKELITNRAYYAEVSETNFKKSKSYASEVLNIRRKNFYDAIKQGVLSNKY